MILKLRKSHRKAIVTIIQYILLIIGVGLLLFPFLWMISISLKPNVEIFSDLQRLIPKNISFEHYKFVLNKTNFGRFFINSVIVAVPVSFFTTFITMFAAYAISRAIVRGRSAVISMILGQQMFPVVLLLIPIFIILRRIGLVNTYGGIILVHITFAIPFTMLMLTGYFESIPAELEEAAMIDGCTRIGAILRITLPLSAPCIAAAATFAFMVSWHEYTFALTILRSEDLRTLPVGLALFKDAHRIMWGPTMAGSVLTVLPAVLLFMFLQKLITKGLVAGAVKG